MLYSGPHIGYIGVIGVGIYAGISRLSAKDG